MAQHRILLADDSSTMHRAVKLALSRGDFEIVAVDNGTDALRICRENAPALLIADLDLPGVSGAELVKLVKGDRQISQTKVILLCSSVHQGDIGRLDKIPADARLWKPFESEAIFTLVQTLLKNPLGPKSSSTMSSASTQQIQRSTIDAETTRPIQKASVLVDRTMPAANNDPSYGSSPTQLQPFEDEGESPVTSRDATNNLWSTDFDSPAVKERLERTGSFNTVPPSATQGGSPTAQTPRKDIKISSPTSASTSPGEKLSAYREASEQWESIQSRPNPTPPPPPQARSQTSVGAATAPQVNREELRNMIRAEIQLAFDSWFKEKLEDKLQEILSQIESESKKRV